MLGPPRLQAAFDGAGRCAASVRAALEELQDGVRWLSKYQEGQEGGNR